MSEKESALLSKLADEVGSDKGQLLRHLFYIYAGLRNPYHTFYALCHFQRKEMRHVLKELAEKVKEKC